METGKQAGVSEKSGWLQAGQLQALLGKAEEQLG